ncbi:hypothetical protein [Mycobacteroides abscessus]|uniref:hypothetical protein n=1 Tax=Mycobacteroides abscessus TaxID=36809 RepID=UPI00092A9DF5|nr:hypothetical protein [Mycobacteroides abscessus]SIG02615.1 Uncharacterised protein [Mycobacteroides abscessus subsp. abscessus]SKW95072.1 Uncharacterised protein [Mycobacteroides abscessus subsp. abscessus]SKY34784.1 Uncharacterised protein [Mycobacteroides abscessus subsp. abscessus]SKZ33649.1 Uncharacterised protein [Mycobacteroides abscessus subsp. abscessus]SKZ78194.1 Uncharacterised protein [Mycobacteroides abscessus subsp. abscessus]
MTKKAATNKSTVTERSAKRSSGTHHRSAATGRFVKASTAARNPNTTITERNAANDKVTRPRLGIRDDPLGEAVSLLDSHLPSDLDEETIERLAAEAEQGVPPEKLRRRGRPSIGEDASSTYSVRLPIDLVTLTDERSAIDGVSRGETIRRALVEYLTK